MDETGTILIFHVGRDNQVEGHAASYAPHATEALNSEQLAWMANTDRGMLAAFPVIVLAGSMPGTYQQYRDLNESLATPLHCPHCNKLVKGK